jgi:hypothetical protein
MWTCFSCFVRECIRFWRAQLAAFGREGTPEEVTAMPVASYDYGAATMDGKLQYVTQSIDLPVDVDNTQIFGTTRDTSRECSR